MQIQTSFQKKTHVLARSMQDIVKDNENEGHFKLEHALEIFSKRNYSCLNPGIGPLSKKWKASANFS